MAKFLSIDDFRVYAVDLTTKIQQLWKERETNYAGAIYLSQTEYDALTEEQKLDSTKTYFITE